MSEATAYLWVYGTLRRQADDRLHPYLEEQAAFLGDATLPGRLYEVAGYPAACYEPKGQWLIQGELYRLHTPAHCLATLDDYEECSPAFPTPQEYRRNIVPVFLKTTASLHYAWVYLYNWPTDNLRWIASGDYAEFSRPSLV